MIHMGLDEAGLGSRLGPFCICLTRFEYSGSQTIELYERLSELVCQTRDSSKRLQITDSKAIFTRSAGIRNLERGVLTFLNAAGIPRTLPFFQLLQALCPAADLTSLTETPWFAGCFDLKIPISQTAYHETESSIDTAIRNCSISVKRPKLRFISAREFNRKLERHGGKGQAIQSILASLVIGILEGNKANTHITIDKQGGRRYYGEWLQNTFPGRKLEILSEEPNRSCYRIGDVSIEFLVRSDSVKLETALASMISKYIREVAMLLFNTWWEKRIPGIRPCAGYPLDANRFIQELRNAENIDEWEFALIRRK